MDNANHEIGLTVPDGSAASQSLSETDAELINTRVLKFTEAVYSLELQKLQLLIDRLREDNLTQANSHQTDYVIRPGRAA